MSLIFDLLILLLFAANVYAGWKNGFIRTVLHTCSTIAAILVANFFSPTLAEYLRSTFLGESVTNRVSEGLAALMEAGNETIDIHQLFSDAPEAFVKLLEGFGIELSVLEAQFADAIESGSETLLTDVIDYIAGPIADMIAAGLAFLILFAGCTILLHIACFFLDTLCRLPVLKQMNTALGLILGIATGFLMAWGLSAVLGAVMPAVSQLYPDVISETVIENTFLVKTLAELIEIPRLS